MAISNSSPYYRTGNIRSLSSYISQSYANNAPPCCLAYVAGGGHDWTCRISGHAFYVNYEQSVESTPRPSATISSPRTSVGADGNPVSDSSEPLLLAHPAYSLIPPENETLPFREFPPTYDQFIRAKRFNFVKYLPGCSRFACPSSRALGPTELAAIGLHIEHPPVRRSVGQACAAALKGDLTWMVALIIGLTFLLGFLLKTYA